LKGISSLYNDPLTSQEGLLHAVINIIITIIIIISSKSVEFEGLSEDVMKPMM